MCGEKHVVKGNVFPPSWQTLFYFLIFKILKTNRIIKETKTQKTSVKWRGLPGSWHVTNKSDLRRKGKKVIFLKINSSEWPHVYHTMISCWLAFGGGWGGTFFLECHKMRIFQSWLILLPLFPHPRLYLKQQEACFECTEKAKL